MTRVELFITYLKFKFNWESYILSGNPTLDELISLCLSLVNCKMGVTL